MAKSKGRRLLELEQKVLLLEKKKVLTQTIDRFKVEQKESLMANCRLLGIDRDRSITVVSKATKLRRQVAQPR